LTNREDVMRGTAIGIAVAAALLLAGCQTTGGSGGPQTTQTRAERAPLPAQCQGVLVPGSPLWNLITEWKGHRPKCARVTSPYGDGTMFQVGAKIDPLKRTIGENFFISMEGGYWRDKAEVVFVLIAQYDSKIPYSEFWRDMKQKGFLLPGLFQGRFVGGPVQARASRMTEPESGAPLGCAVALADTARDTTTAVTVCRSLIPDTDAAALELGRRIAREDFPSINP